MNAVTAIEMRSEEARVFWRVIAPSEHIVQIYEDDAPLLGSLEGFVASGLEAGEGVIIMAPLLNGTES